MQGKNILFASGTFILVMLVSVVLPMHPVSAWAATENDLRYVTGVGRLDEKTIQKKTNRFSDRLALDNTYNEMVKVLKDSGLNTDVTEKKVESEKKAYNSLMDAFISGESASDVKEKLSGYDKYAVYDDSYTESGETFDYTDTTKVRGKIAALKQLKDIAKDKTDIGGISNKLPSLTRKPYHISDIGEGYAVFDVNKGQKIYCVLSGIIIKKTDKSVTVKSGKTIYVTYKGIKPYKGPGTRISQKSLLGTAKGRHVRVDMTMNGEPVNILTAAGNKGVTAYKSYMSENPWTEYAIDTSVIKCTSAYKAGVGKKKKIRSNVIGYYYDNGKKKKLTTNTGKKGSGSGNLFNGDPFDEDEDVSAETGSK